LKIFKQERSSFLKKRTKKLLVIVRAVVSAAGLRGPHGLFFKNEALPS
jgi:hypothetical protein